MDIDKDRVQWVRQRYGVGLLEAKKIVRKEKLMALIDNAQSIEDLKMILKEIVVERLP